VPKRLPDRWSPECIAEFRAAAWQRYLDALRLAEAERKTGAIYLWGYSAEMLLKAAYFSVLGFARTATIDFTHLNSAISRGRMVFAIPWPRPGAGHNIRAWAELLVRERIALGVAYPNPFALDLQQHGARISRLWTESLRYHKNVAYKHEVKRVRDAVDWLLVNETRL
jgi:hypothetical protein